MGRRQKIDWDVVEPEYRRGVLSLRQLADAHGVTEAAIRKTARVRGWDRDIGARIQLATEAKVRKAEIKVRENEKVRATERELIEANANAAAEILLTHRKDTTKARELFGKLIEEALVSTTNIEDLKNLGELMRNPDENGMDRLNDLYHKIISMPERIKGGKVLTDMLTNYVNLDRKSFGLDRELEKEQQAAERKASVESAVTTALTAAEAYARLKDGK